MNDDGASFFFGLFLACVLYWAFPVIAHVLPADWQQAEAVCAANEGVRSVERPSLSLFSLGEFQVDCNNGGTFFLTSTEVSH